MGTSFRAENGSRGPQNQKPSPAFTGEGEAAPSRALFYWSEHAPGGTIRLSPSGHTKRKAPAMVGAMGGGGEKRRAGGLMHLSRHR